MKRNIIITIVIILLLVGFIALKNNKEKPQENTEVKLEPMSKDLNTELRSLLPGDCNGITSLIFKNKKVNSKEVEGLSSICAIGGTPYVYLLEDKSGISGNKAYIYDYVLIYFAHTENNKHWANTDGEYIYEDEIEEDDNAYPTDSSFHKYGKLYKHTFEKKGKYYIYVSTEPAK